MPFLSTPSPVRCLSTLDDEMFLHPLPPPPGPFDFSAALIPTSASSVSPTHLTRATQHRQAVRSLLASHQTARANGGSTGPIEIKLIQAIDDYLPSLVAIFNSCRTDELVWRGTADAAATAPQAPFVWYALLSVPSASTSSSAFKSRPEIGPFASSSILFELDNILILYSLALSNLAILQSIAVASYEFTNRTLSEDDRKAKETSLKRGVAWGRKAVAVIRWLIDHEDTLLSPGAAPQEAGDDWSSEKETSRRRLLAGLLSFHQLVPTLLTLRVLLSPSQCHATSTQTLPPPLPPSHPSPALLAKLFLEIPRIADECRGELEAASGRGSSSAGSKSKRFFTSRNDGESSKLSSKFKSLGIRHSKDKEHNGQGNSSRRESDLLVPSASERMAGGDERPALDHRTSPGQVIMNSRGKQDPGRARSQSSLQAPPSVCPISDTIFRYLDAVSSYSRAVAYMYQSLAAAEGAGGGKDDEAGSGGRIAEAIVWLRLARSELVGEEGSSKETTAASPKAWAEWTGQKETAALLTKILAGHHFEGRGSNSKAQDAKEPRKGGLLNAARRGRDEPTNGSNGDLLSASLDGNVHDATTSSSVTSHVLAHRLQTHHSTLLLTALAPSLCHLARSYISLNDTVTFQPLPSKAEVQQKLPSSRAVLYFDTSPGAVGGSGGEGPANSNFWRPPSPEFGPKRCKIDSGESRLPRGMGLILGSAALLGQTAGVDESEPSPADGHYAGQGAYY